MKKIYLIVFIFIILEAYSMFPEEKKKDLRTPAYESIRLRESPTTSGKIIRLLVMWEKLEVVEEGNTETIGGRTGPWVKVNSEKGDAGWCFGPLLCEDDYYMRASYLNDELLEKEIIETPAEMKSKFGNPVNSKYEEIRNRHDPGNPVVGSFETYYYNDQEICFSVFYDGRILFMYRNFSSSKLAYSFGIKIGAKEELIKKAFGDNLERSQNDPSHLYIFTGTGYGSAIDFWINNGTVVKIGISTGGLD